LEFNFQYWYFIDYFIYLEV